MQLKLKKILIEEWLFSLSVSGLVLISLVTQRIPHYSTDDFQVVFTLFVFLVIVNGLQRENVLRFLAANFQGNLGAVKLVAITGILSIFVTNDAALITMVPLTLVIDFEDAALVVILETLMANAVSALTPFGNPQNLFIYYHYNVSPADFVHTILPFVLVMSLVILFMSLRVRANPEVEFSGKPSREGWIYVGMFLLFIAAVLKIVPLWVGVIVLGYALLFDRRRLRVDYFLLGTFLAFFGFTDNVSHLLRFELEFPHQTFFTAAFLSQIMSNVPSALLIADFTSDWKALLWGVNVGGFGTLIASLANLISYRIYSSHRNKERTYLIRFHLYSFSLFLLGIILYLVIE
ncbi:SLC13 family permease [Thermococcus piezophilus]|uniref:Citrate transporter-like domain-containing protein n=1 Tax=Thermococcus piezophilus TaxID=1712654 RepID=A0A172WIW6_9EURY|nr:SLC13 family permease [Thermococcus piezophilus]ANF23422.1 hypothetical protein A7C91_09800 [Thermococcus piezophilus]